MIEYKWEKTDATFLGIIYGLDTLLEILHTFGLNNPQREVETDGYGSAYEQAIRKQFARVSTFCRNYGSADSWVKYFKYKTCSFFAFYENQPLPPKPEGLGDDKPGYLFGGVIGQWVKSQLHQGNGELALSILMAKKGMPSVSKTLIEAAEAAMVKTLTTQRETRQAHIHPQFVDDDSLLRMYRFENRRIKLSVEEEASMLEGAQYERAHPEEKSYWYEIKVTRLKEEMRRTVKEIFKGKTFGKSEMEVPTFPSTSANYNNTRSKAGTAGFIKTDTELLKQLGQFDFSQFFEQSKQVYFDGIAQYYGQRGREAQEAINRDCSEEVDSYVYDPTNFEAIYHKFYWDAFEAAMGEIPHVVPVGLAEALKIRVISKGPPLTYFVLKTFQKFMWTTLKNINQFSLIGRMVRIEDFEDVCGFELGTWFNSGDYSAATDNLYGWVSETIVEEIGRVCQCEPDLITLAKRALTGHLFPGEKEQATGQLMGSIVSFPILCIANAALCRHALELAECMVIPLWNTRMRINGDDNLIATKSKNFNYIWERVCHVAGLDSSVGKTYWNQKFAVINSFHADFADGRWVERRYLNLKLLRKQRQTDFEEETSTRPLLEVASNWNKLIDTCPVDIMETVRKKFFYYNTETLKSFKGSYWLPQWCGGLGMRKTEEDQELCRQIRMCQMMRNKGDNPRTWPLEKDWTTWDVANRFLKDNLNIKSVAYSKVLNTDIHDLERDQDRVTRDLVISTWMNNDIKSLYSGQKNFHRLFQSVIKANEKYFRKINRNLKTDRKVGCGIPWSDYLEPYSPKINLNIILRKEVESPLVDAEEETSVT